VIVDNKGVKLNDLQIYCGIDTRDGKLTGSTCRVDDPNYQTWAMTEMATKDVRLEKFTVMQFLEKLHTDGFDVERYINYLEARV